MHSKDPLAPMPQNRQAKEDLLQWRPEGLYCPLGGFYIDPWKPVERALITHAHADHAKAGHQAYLATPDTVALMQARLGLQETACERIAYLPGFLSLRAVQPSGGKISNVFIS